MNRRRALKTTTVLLAAAPLAGCSGQLATFASWQQAREAVQALLLDDKLVQGSPWNLSQVLQHLAQSIEYSMQGYPALKSAWFRHSVGPAAFAVFDARGRMSHDLAEPIPGAPALEGRQALKTSVDRLLAAMDGFRGFNGGLRPHFAYGELARPQYERAHLMHLAHHWTQFHARTATA